MFFVYFLFFICLFSFLFYSVHYLYMLLILEGLLLAIFMFLVLNFLTSYSFSGIFLFLLLMVCLGGFSISLLVSLSRFWGRDFWYFSLIF